MTENNNVTTPVNAEGMVVKTVSVASDGEQIGAAAIGLVTAGPLGALAAWGAIRMFAGKWTPWMLTGFVAAPILGFVQVIMMGVLMAPFAEMDTKNDDQSSLVLPSEVKVASLTSIDLA